MKHVLLVNAKTRGPYRPTGLEYVAEYLETEGFEPRVLDLTVEQKAPWQAVSRALRDGRYDAVGISIFNTQWDRGRDRVDFLLPDVRDLVARIKEETNLPVILGGFGFSIQPRDILAYVGGDYGVSGCGIPAVKDLLLGIGSGALKRGTVLSNRDGGFLDRSYRRDVLDPARYPEPSVLVSSKDEHGCAARCHHCPVSGPMRLRDPAHVVAEIRNLAGQGIREFGFSGDLFNVPCNHAGEICRGIAGLQVSWSAYIYPWRRHMNPGFADLLKASGMAAAEVGSRSIGSERMLKRSGQRFTRDDLAYATILLKERGIKTWWFVGFGAPGESRETLDETFGWIDEVRPDSVAMITKARIYKGTRLAAIAEKEGIIQPEDNLLAPAYYPFDETLRDYVWEQAGKRPGCTVYY